MTQVVLHYMCPDRFGTLQKFAYLKYIFLLVPKKNLTMQKRIHILNIGLKIQNS
jgi:hypothetical protein